MSSNSANNNSLATNFKNVRKSQKDTLSGATSQDEVRSFERTGSKRNAESRSGGNSINNGGNVHASHSEPSSKRSKPNSYYSASKVF